LYYKSGLYIALISRLKLMIKIKLKLNLRWQLRSSVFKLAVVGSGILLLGVLWFHIGCFNVKVFHVALQRMSCILLNMFQISA